MQGSSETALSIQHIYTFLFMKKSGHVYCFIQPWCATHGDDRKTIGNNWDLCGPDCHMDSDPFTDDNTLKVVHQNNNEKERRYALKIFAIMSFSILLTGLINTRLGKYVKFASHPLNFPNQ